MVQLPCYLYISITTLTIMSGTSHVLFLDVLLCGTRMTSDDNIQCPDTNGALVLIARNIPARIIMCASAEIEIFAQVLSFPLHDAPAQLLSNRAGPALSSFQLVQR
jgi:hypothetical protein